MKSEGRQRIICVDLDGVILTYERGWASEGIFGFPVDEVLMYLRCLKEDGWYVIVYTVRGDREKIVSILSSYGILSKVHYDVVNRRKNVIPGSYKGKIGADVYLDDRAITFKGDWKKAYQQIKMFKPWCESGESNGDK